MRDVLQVRPYSQPIGDSESIMNLCVILCVTNRHERRIIVIIDPGHLIHQLGMTCNVIIDMDPRDTNTKIIVWSRIKHPLIGEAQLNKVIHQACSAIHNSGIEENTQPTIRTTRTRCQLLLRNKPRAVLGTMRLEIATAQSLRLAILALVNILRFRGAVEVADSILTR
ncbi:hypothetical protein D3C76_1238080 [compost metagenome]